jgi:hypothetical protein
LSPPPCIGVPMKHPGTPTNHPGILQINQPGIPPDHSALLHRRYTHPAIQMPRRRRRTLLPCLFALGTLQFLLFSPRFVSLGFMGPNYFQGSMRSRNACCFMGVRHHQRIAS